MPEMDSYEFEALEAGVRRRIAAMIFAEEQRCIDAANADPLNPHLSGRLAGLQRARDIAEATQSKGEQ